MTIIITIIVVSYAASIMINIVLKKDYVLDQKTGELRTSYYRFVKNQTTNYSDMIWYLDDCSRNLSECKAFTYKEYADIFINGLYIYIFIPSTSQLDCSKYSVYLKESTKGLVVWSENFKNPVYFDGKVQTCTS
jgi:hypothetical protein